jgi:NADH dehydrogenase/NADH:ubiquinone oxidoreductase subunit G
MLASAPESEEIRKLAKKYQVFETPYKHNPKKWNNKCIMCGLCVRVCDEIMDVSAIGFAKRGSERYIATPLDEYSETIGQIEKSNLIHRFLNVD